MFNWFKKKATRYGDHVFTFPDGKKLYQIKEDYFEKLPAAKLRTIQENSNYIAFLGISKSTLEAGHRMIKDKIYEIGLLSQKRDKTELNKTIEDAKKLIEGIDTTRKEYDGMNEAIMVSTFDLFYFFEGEDIFRTNEETLELKRHYLNEYPYFRNFFFQKLNGHLSDFKITYQNCINFALAQTAIQEVVKDLSLTDISESKTS
jgi:tRNA 2-selenouridine synthase SelU